MRRKTGTFLFLGAVLGALLWNAAGTQALAPCGKSGKAEAAPQAQASAAPAASAALSPGRLLLPGQRARNFQLPAVVGDQIKMVKLSDFQGKWRVLCFYPADFTFV